MKLSELLCKDEYYYSNLKEDIEVAGIVTNPEDVEEGTILMIQNSTRLREKIKCKKVPIAIAADKKDNLPKNIPMILLKNARISVARAYYRLYNIEKTHFKTVAITGTNGKTSTAYFIKSILLAQGKRVGYIGTGIIEICGKPLSDSRYSMTTPDPELLYSTLAKMELERCDVVILEVSSHALALEKVEPMLFDYAVFTNLSSEHGDFHPTMEDYFAAKCKLFQQCQTAFFNLDDPYSRRAVDISSAKKKICVGVLHKGDIFATNIENNGENGISYLYRTSGFMFKMNIGIPGIYNVYNSLLASAVCIEMGCPPCEVKSAARALKMIPGRFEIIKDEVTVIIDFAHTELAFESFLREVKAFAGASRLSVIFGCGGERDKEKRPKMAAIAERYADRITVTSDNPRNEDPEKIITEIIKGFSHKKHTVITDRRLAITDIICSADRNEIIAIVGKGAEKYMIDKDGYHTFDEKEIIKAALQVRKAPNKKCVLN